MRPGCDGFFMTNAMGADPFAALMIVHQVQVAGVAVLEAEYQPVVAGDREYLAISSFSTFKAFTATLSMILTPPLSSRMTARTVQCDAYCRMPAPSALYI
jgi:hypothetical protein